MNIDQQAAELMSARLIAMKDQLISMAMRKYELSVDDAEDVFSTTCVYMLSRGIHLLDMSKCFDAAIMSTMRRRAHNHKHRDSWRQSIDFDLYNYWQENDMLADDRAEDACYAIDHDIFSRTLLSVARSENQRIIAIELAKADDDFNINKIARKYRCNKNTLHGAYRYMKEYMRKHYEQEQEQG